MLEIPLKKYCEMTGQSRQSVHAKVKDGKLESRKDESGRVFILLDIDIEDKLKNENSIAQVKEVFGALVIEMKEQNREIIEKLEGGHKREIENMKETYNKILDLKDDEIKRLRDRGFFKRLFGD